MTELAEVSGKTRLYEELLFTEEQVTKRVDEMAEEIISQYDPENTLFVGLLNGALPFHSALMKSIAHLDPEFHPNAQFMTLSRYGENREPVEQPRLVMDLPNAYADLTGQVVVVVDDLIDEGVTLNRARDIMLSRGAAEVNSLVLVKKDKEFVPLGNQAIRGMVKFGFAAPDKWLTGMGMDDARLTIDSNRLGGEGNRWAPWIAIANPQPESE
ncbi:MAG: phosphoribosyltransferase family protein [Candidatus Saccharimonadales bacterium]